MSTAPTDQEPAKPPPDPPKQSPVVKRDGVMPARRPRRRSDPTVGGYVVHWKLDKTISKDKKRPVVPNVSPRIYASPIPPPTPYFRSMPPGPMPPIDPSMFQYPMAPLMPQAISVIPASMMSMSPMTSPAIPSPHPMPSPHPVSVPMPTPLPLQRPPERPVSRASPGLPPRRRNSLPDIRVPDVPPTFAQPQASSPVLPAVLPAFREEEVKQERSGGLPSIGPLLRGVEHLQMDEETAAKAAVEAQARLTLSKLTPVTSVPGMPSSSTPSAKDSVPSPPPSAMEVDPPASGLEHALEDPGLRPSAASMNGRSAYSLPQPSPSPFIPPALPTSLPYPAMRPVSKMSIASLLQ